MTNTKRLKSKKNEKNRVRKIVRRNEKSVLNDIKPRVSMDNRYERWG
jgi:hypothetical protein